jgi:hypothetical protein
MAKKYAEVLAIPKPSKSPILSRYGRTVEQADEFYDATRAKLSETIALVDHRDPSYLPLLSCETCKKASRHRFAEMREGKTADGKSATIERQIWECLDCGTGRAWGNGIQL